MSFGKRMTKLNSKQERVKSFVKSKNNSNIKFVSDNNFLEYVKNNELDMIWYNLCNLDEGIKVSAYTPLFPDNNIISHFEKKCTKIDCNGTLVIPIDDINNKVIFKRVCNGDNKGLICNKSESILYRWISPYNKHKLWFNDFETIYKYALMGRTFYSTNVVYDIDIVKSKSNYTDEKLIKACSLYMDFDIKQGTILDVNNKIELNKAISIVREQLDTFVPDSYNVQTSGNGAYIMLHHKLATKDLFNIMAKYNAWTRYMNEMIQKEGITKIKIDAINMPSRVFKLIASPHQKYDLVAIPLEYDCDISKIDNDKFKLKNFNISDYKNDDDIFSFCDRFKKYDIMSLYNFLDEHCEKNIHSDLRAVRYDYTISSNAITNSNLDENIKKPYFNKQSSEWQTFNSDIHGRVIYKIKNGHYEIEMLGIKKEDVQGIVDEIKQLKGV